MTDNPELLSTGQRAQESLKKLLGMVKENNAYDQRLIDRLRVGDSTAIAEAEERLKNSHGANNS